MNVKKITALIVLFLCSIFYTMNAHANSQFSDVTKDNGAYEEINYLVNLGIISGYTEKNQRVFKPYNYVTRGQVIKMVVLAAGYEPVVKATSSFVDIDPKKSSELSSYIESAVKNGLISVPTDKKFNPNASMRRDEMSKILALAFKIDVKQYGQSVLPFEDINKENAYYPYIAAIYYSGVTQGTPTKTGAVYEPSGFVKRSQFSSFVARALSDTYRLKVPTQGVAVPNEEQVIKKVYVTTSSLNVRLTPISSSNANVIGKVTLNEELKVYAEKDGWLQIDFKGQLAYVSSTYTKLTPAIEESGNEIPNEPIQQDPESVEQETEPAQPVITTPVITSAVKGIATVNALSIRAEASSTSKLLAQISRGVEVAVISINGNWAKVKYNGIDGYINKTYLRLKNTTGSAVAGRIIVLDPGHGGKDSGAKFDYTGGGRLLEKDVVLKVAQLVRQKLEKDGAIVKMTRTNDTFIELTDRVKFTKNNYAELFLSIHVNAASSKSASGTETFYSKVSNDNELEDAALATAINNQIVANAQMKNRGVKRENYVVIAGVVMPAVLIELGFISNDGDRAKLENDQFIEIYAQSIYNGIVQYYAK